MKNTASAITAKNEALKRIRDNIEKIYDDYIINENIYVFQKSYGLDKEFYKRYEDKVAAMTDIEDLVNFLNTKWLEQLREEDKIEMSESIIRLNVLIEQGEIEAAKNYGISRPSQETFRKQTDEFLKHAISEMMRGNSRFFERININPNLWRGVVAAMLLCVPVEKVILCEESILNRYFLPIIKNEHLIMRINELTKPGDFEVIWDLVKVKQNAYVEKHGYINSTVEYPSRKADKIIYTFSQRGFNIDEIHGELKKACITKKYSGREIRERIKEYKRQTRQPA